MSTRTDQIAAAITNHGGIDPHVGYARARWCMEVAADLTDLQADLDAIVGSTVTITTRPCHMRKMCRASYPSEASPDLGPWGS